MTRRGSWWGGLLTLGPALAATLGIAATPGEQPALHAFTHGERLTYRIAWHGVPAGTGILRIEEPVRINEREVFHVVSEAQSNDFVSLFYPVDDHVETFIDVAGIYPHRTTVRQREGKTRRYREVYFDHTRRRARQLFEGREEFFDIPEHVQDSLSALYYLRTVNPLVVGQSVMINIHDNGRNWTLEAKVLGKERVRTFAGSFETFKVAAYLKFKGLWLDKGNVYVWLTDDSKRTPVLVRGEVRIGAVTATLTAKEDGAAVP